MPFVANTPESLVKRTDSKDPSTTCRGITSSGRPCRNALAPSDNPAPKPKPKKKGRALPDPSNPDHYCWRHKDQATSSPGPQSNGPILDGRASIDTLTGRLGLLMTNTSRPEKPSRPHNSSSSFVRPSKPSKELSFCCFRIPLDFIEEEPTPPPRPHSYPMQPSGSPKPSKPPSSQYLKPTSPKPQKSSRPSLSSQTPSTGSQTSQLLSLIPQDAPPQTASQLMAELAKPLSKGDEAGYIYIFWLQPEEQLSSPPTQNTRAFLDETARSLPDTETATRSILDPSSPVRPAGHQRQPSDILRSFADQADSIGTRSPTTTRSRGLSSGDDKKTLLLKIGRANNVQRRMNEWKRQCGYDLSLIRYYPYVQTGSITEPRKMPHSHKVEKLIHMELEGLGLRVASRGPCEACGREHKEWFEVDASKNGVMRVDEAIKRWSDWDEGRTSP
ncbi:hypothetical protein N8I77_009445 [Diaporthe amygdali]|uniref:Bacteriophage T5 Orf172 DNA-binding domain-containing protein n=1 Tax=Phomopsis amygdali TaxID=1214568 RepID=A0AAD9S9J9_PHOAM|nr:hypothetical protein N8I77_009445 [Diaporthe amygdali]